MIIKAMLDNAVHIGSKRQFWSPKMKNYIYGVQNGVHVFDLEKTEKKLEALSALLADFSAKWKNLLIVGTKPQASELVAKIAKETNNYYIDNTWVPGLLTNFPTIKKRIATYNTLEKSALEGGFTGLTKKEISGRMKELEKLRTAYEGIKDMKKTPDALLVIDGHFEDLALTEARSLGIPAYALLGTTGDIDKTTDFVPCNVNSVKSLEFLMNHLKPSLKKEKRAENPLKAQKEKIEDSVEA